MINSGEGIEVVYLVSGVSVVVIDVCGVFDVGFVVIVVLGGLIVVNGVVLLVLVLCGDVGVIGEFFLGGVI